MNIHEYFEWEHNEYEKIAAQIRDWRLGQAYYNQFDKSGQPFPELFFETDKDKARDLIFKYYFS